MECYIYERIVKALFTKVRDKITSTHIDYYPTIHSLFSMIPRETREHMERVGAYSQIIFEQLRNDNPQMVREEFGEDFVKYSQDIFKYHDIGRIYIPFAVLNKVEKLSDEEFQLIKDHAINAAKAIDSVYKKPFPRDMMERLLEVALYHHERWDGKGYPKGIAGEEIPLGGRLCAIADTYDGITSWKPYKKRQTTKAEAVEIIVSESGKQFDPYMVQIFKNSLNRI